MNGSFDRCVIAAGRVNLVDISDTLEPLSRKAAEESWSYVKFACELFEEQARRADERSRETLTRFASFPFQKTLGEFDFDFQPNVSQTVLRELAECGYVRENQNIIFLGPPGTGKTHLAVALGIEATNRRLRVKFTTCQALITRLKEAKERNTY